METKPTIIFENEHLIAVNKPAGLVIHSDGKTKEPTLCDWILEVRPQIKGVGEVLVINKGTSSEQVLERPGIVHRLDRETSGVMVIAKTQASFEDLKRQFQDRETKKIYHAIVWGNIKENEGKIDRAIGRSKSDFRKWSAERFARGELRPAVTDFKVLGRLNENTKGGQDKIPLEFSYLEVSPLTGRTHQIRVHLKAINHPVIGDSLYAPNHPKVLGFDRTALHAFKLKIEDVDGTQYEFEAPLPQDFINILGKFNLQS